MSIPTGTVCKHWCVSGGCQHFERAAVLNGLSIVATTTYPVYSEGVNPCSPQAHQNIIRLTNIEYENRTISYTLWNE